MQVFGLDDHAYEGVGPELKTIPQSRLYLNSRVIRISGEEDRTPTDLAFLYESQKEYDAILWFSADPEKETEILRNI